MKKKSEFMAQKKIFSLRKFKAYGLGTAILGTVVFGGLQAAPVKADEVEVTEQIIHTLTEEEAELESQQSSDQELSIAEGVDLVSYDIENFTEESQDEAAVISSLHENPLDSEATLTEDRTIMASPAEEIETRLDTSLFTITSVEDKHVPESDFVAAHNQLTLSLTLDDSVQAGSYIDIQSGYTYEGSTGEEFRAYIRANRANLPVQFAGIVVGEVEQNYESGYYSDRLIFNESINTLKNVSLDLVLNYAPLNLYADKDTKHTSSITSSLTINDYKEELLNFRHSVTAVSTTAYTVSPHTGSSQASVTIGDMWVTRLPDGSRYASHGEGETYLSFLILPQSDLYTSKQVVIELELPEGSILEQVDSPGLSTIDMVSYQRETLSAPLTSNNLLFENYRTENGTDYPFIKTSEQIGNRTILTIDATSENNLNFSMRGTRLTGNIRIPASAKEKIDIPESTVEGETSNWSYPLVDQSLSEHPLVVRLYADGVLKETLSIDSGDYNTIRTTAQTIPPNAVRLLGENETSEDIETKEVLPFKTERRANPDLKVGTEIEVQAGVAGERTLIHRIIKRDGDLVSNTLISDKVTLNPVNQIIEYGTAVEEVEEVTETHDIPFNTGIRYNDQLPEGEEREIQPGVIGQKIITKRITRLNGVVIKEEIVSERTVREAQDRLLELGTMREWEEVLPVSVSVPFETVRRPNPDLPQGQEREIQAGIDGVLNFTEVMVYRNGQVVRTYRKNEQLQPATNRIIEYGTLVESQEEVQRVESIPFKTIRRNNPSLLEGEEQTVQVGIIGQKTLTYLQTKQNGQVVNEQLVSEKVTLPAQDEIIEYGTIKETFRQVDQSIALPFTTHRRENPALLKGEERVVQVGVEGEKVLTYLQTLHNGLVVAEQLISEVESKSPVDEIIEYGSLVVSTEEIRRNEALPFATIRRENPALLKGEERVVQVGVEGEKVLTYLQTLHNGLVVAEQLISEVESKSPVDEIIEYGSLVVTTEEIRRSEALPFATIRKENPALLKGEERVVQVGVEGEKVLTYLQTLHNGVVVDEQLISEVESKSPVDEIVEYGSLVVTTEEIRRTESLPFITIRRENPALLKGEERVVQVGVEGEKVLTYLQTLHNGVVVAEQLISEVESQSPVDEIIEYGSLVVTTEEIRRTESLPFTTHRRENSALLKGEERVVQVGVEGEKVLTYLQTLYNGVVVDEQLISEVESKSPIDEIIEYGSLVVITEEIRRNEALPFATIRKENPTLLKGEERVVQVGVEGEKVLTYLQTLHNGLVVDEQLISEVESKSPVDEIIEYGSLVVSTEEIRRTESLPFTTVRKENPALLKGEERIVQVGVEGEKVLTYLRTLHNGVVVAEQLISEVESKSLVDEIIDYGSLVVTTEEIRRNEALPFATIRKENPALLKGEERVVQVGVEGEKVLTYLQTLHNGLVVAEQLISEVESKSPVDEIIEYGSLVVSTEEIRRTESLPFNTVRKENPILLKGEERVVQVGVEGEKVLTYLQTLHNGLVVDEQLISEVESKSPVDEIVEYGSLVVTTEEIRRIESLPFDTIRRENPALLKGEECVVQVGVEGEKVLTYLQTLHNGLVVDEQLISEVESTSPVDEIIEYGTLVEIIGNRTLRQELAFKEVRRVNPQLPLGQERVLLEGQAGERVQIYRQIFHNGILVSEELISDSVTSSPVDRIVEYGSLLETAPSPVSHTVESASQSSAVLPKTGEEANLLPLAGLALLGISGLRIRKPSNADE